MPRFLKAPSKAAVFGALMFLQMILVSLQVPRGREASLFERSAFTLLSPVQRILAAVSEGIGSVWGRYAGLRGVEDRNRVLQDENIRLRIENGILRNRFRTLLDREAASAALGSLGREFLLASTIGWDVANPYNSIIIDRGSRDGVRPDMTVVDAYGRLVGRIIEPVEARASAVQLLTDDNSAVGVVGEFRRTPGVLTGDSAHGRCWLKYVPAASEELSENETLITSGSDRIFPPGLTAGTILSIGTDGSLFKRIAVRPAFDARDLSTVAVLTGNVLFPDGREADR